MGLNMYFFIRANIKEISNKITKKKATKIERRIVVINFLNELIVALNFRYRF